MPSATISSEKIVYGFLRGTKNISLSVTDDAVGQITVINNTGNPQVYDFQIMRKKGAVSFGGQQGDTDFVIYVRAGSLTYSYDNDDFIIESQRTISNGAVTESGAGITKLPEATIATSVAGGNDVISATDSHKIAKLYGTPGSGTVQWFHADAQHSKYYDPVFGNYYDFVGVENSTQQNRQNYALVVQPQLDTYPIEWEAMSASQKSQYAYNLVNFSFLTNGISANGAGGITMATSASMYFTMINKKITWDGTSWNAGIDNADVIPSYNVVDSSFNTFIAASAGVPDQGINGILNLGIGTGTGKMDVQIVASDGNLGFYGTTPIPRRTAANVGAGGSRVGTTGNAVTDGSTFDGGIAGQNYTIGQIVRALKQLGLLS